MMTNSTIWNKLKGEPMQKANPCNLFDEGDVTVPTNTGFCYKLGGGQTWGLYFPKGGEIVDAGYHYAGTAAQPIEVWNDAAGRGSSQLEEKTFGIPEGWDIVCDHSAKGLQFTLGSGGAVATQPINLAPMISGAKRTTTPSGVAQSGTAVKAKSSKVVPKPGRNTVAGKIVGIGNWNVIPDFLAD